MADDPKLQDLCALSYQIPSTPSPEFWWEFEGRRDALKAKLANIQDEKGLEAERERTRLKTLLLDMERIATNPPSFARLVRWFTDAPQKEREFWSEGEGPNEPTSSALTSDPVSRKPRKKRPDEQEAAMTECVRKHLRRYFLEQGYQEDQIQSALLDRAMKSPPGFENGKKWPLRVAVFEELCKERPDIFTPITARKTWQRLRERKIIGT